MRRTIEIALFSVALLLGAMAFHAWIASHDDQLRLQATLGAQKQLLDAAPALVRGWRRRRCPRRKASRALTLPHVSP